MKEKPKNGARTQALFNTGTRIHRPAKGKGSFRRKPKHPAPP